ncbi:MAG: hypothetical protein ABI946_02070 [Chthoniobacterales bacterium]
MNDEKREKTIQHIRWAIWLYFGLLLAEGALRKWVLPQLASPLLLVRDPVVIVAYFLALRARVFPTNGWVFALTVIGLLSFGISFVPLYGIFPNSRIFLTAVYGLRCNFLHLPFIFLMATVLRREDVEKIGWWTLVLMGPMAALMVAQFQSSPDSFLNRTSTGEGDMMLAALGKVRTAGPFSFVVGVVYYLALATGFVLWAALKRGVYKNWLLLFAAVSIVIGTAVSGSRSVVGACGVVVASLLLVLIVRPSAVNRLGQTLLVVLILGFVVTKTPIFKEGVKVLSTRFNSVAEAEDTSVSGSLVARFFGEFGDGLFVLAKAPFLGYGLGVGTNGGSKLLIGQSAFLLSESEWSRVFLESGPVLGLAFIVWRCSLAIRIGFLCLGSVTRERNLLPLLLFSSSFLPMINGQFGQTTILGFGVFVTGLALAARKEHALEDGPLDLDEPDEPLEIPGRPRVARCSPYALRLHGLDPGDDDNSSHGHDDSNGAVDR